MQHPILFAWKNPSWVFFLNVNDTSGQGLFDVLQEELKNLDLDIDNVRGQGYDNGSNMKGKHQGLIISYLLLIKL
jgi:hypothetical protein